MFCGLVTRAAGVPASVPGGRCWNVPQFRFGIFAVDAKRTMWQSKLELLT